MRAILAIIAAVGVSSVSIVACSSTHSNNEHSEHSNDAATSDDDDETDTDAGADEGTPGVTLKAPVIDEIMAMAGGLHIMWTNKQTDCDSIEGERKTDADAYKVVFKISDGSVDNKHDAPLDEGTTYTYRLRCKKGADYSPYSNEKSGTP